MDYFRNIVLIAAVAGVLAGLVTVSSLDRILTRERIVTLAFAVGGASLLLGLHRSFVQKRPLFGPGARR
jgi:hypothetical protein